MKSETKIAIVSVFLLIACAMSLAVSGVLYGLKCRALEKDCEALQEECTKLEETTPEYCYFKSEPDGDYELIYKHSGNSWGMCKF